MEVDDATLCRLLDRWPVGRLATVTPAGAPHVLPVVFVAEAGCVYSPVDPKRKSGTRLARVRNIEAHGRASLLLDHYESDWARLWWVRLDGDAWVERTDAALLDRVGRRLQEKYPQYRSLASTGDRSDALSGEPYAGTRTLIALRWHRVRAWSQSGELTL